MCNDQSESSQNFNYFSVKGLDGSNSSTVPLERFLLHFASALMNQCLHDFSKQQSQQERAVQIQIHPVGFLRCSSFEDNMLFYIYIYLYIYIPLIRSTSIQTQRQRNKETNKNHHNTPTRLVTHGGPVILFVNGHAMGQRLYLLVITVPFLRFGEVFHLIRAL